jgi:hypothetical protein
VRCCVEDGRSGGIDKAPFMLVFFVPPSATLRVGVYLGKR